MSGFRLQAYTKGRTGAFAKNQEVYFRSFIILEVLTISRNMTIVLHSFWDIIFFYTIEPIETECV